MISTKPSLTDAGRALLMRALMGETLTFTRMAIGSGELQPDQDQDELTALIAEELSITPTRLDTSDEGMIKISGDFTNEDVPRSFVWRELGIYAKGSEDNVELLYAYANDGEAAGVLRAVSTDILTEQSLTVVVDISDAENVDGVFNPHPQYAFSVTVTGHINDKTNPHQVTKEQIGLGNVLNLSPDNMPVNFVEASPTVPLNANPFYSSMTLSHLFYYVRVFCNAYFKHEYSRSNPHSVTKSQIGLGNVVNKSPNNMTITFTEADTSENLDGDKDLFSGSTLQELCKRIAKAVHELFGHADNNSNPHRVTKEQVGLGNVENTAPSFNVINFEPRNAYAIPATGENMSVIMSKVAKDLSDLQTHLDIANNPNPHGVRLGQIASVGSYIGDGAQGRTVSLDFSPSAVLIYDEFGRTYNPSKGVCGGLARSGRGIRIPNSQTADDATVWSNTYTALMCVDGGFKVNYLSGATADDSIDTNEHSVVYNYVAFR